ncbi:hypothetical protein [Virgibacillus siamensis]|uniref:hypothetical protein n=1 Tax=Virgibacillus siamensis TaxID=480071 RepID=UPI0009869760|nr:hypothetical protein [Virgibacillus siamensis]
MEIHCGNCHKEYEKSEYVVMDEFHSLIHLKCFKPTGFIKIKDHGTYGMMKEKYSFYRNLGNFDEE